LEGLARALPPEELNIIVNTGDDIEMFGLYIAPDLDIVTYTLAGLVNPATGWGINNDTFYCLDLLLHFYDRAALVQPGRPRPGDAHLSHASIAARHTAF
jgi:2-phospho-L-lactate transferase/gluconeogenesis factor (CofD/UPF0052 family)